MTGDPISYDLEGAVAATGLGERTLREAVKAGRLVARVQSEGKRGQKFTFRRDELDEYIAALPVWTPPTT